MGIRENVRHILDLARADVDRRKSALALQHLKTVQDQIEDFRGSSLWAEYQLIFADALWGLNDPAARSQFEEALDRVSCLSEPDLILAMLIHEHFACYLVSKREWSSARQHYESAKRLAIESRLIEDSARIQLRIITVDLERIESPLVRSLQNLKKAGTQGDYTPQEQLAAWFRYLGDIGEQGGTMIAARGRNVASAEYFVDLLSSIRRTGNEIVG